MKTLVFTALSLLVFAVNANSSTIDAPHNSSNGILCSACHSYSFWWAYSPLNQEYQGYAELVDSVCLNCHDGVAAIGDPCEHSSAAMEEMHNRDLGDWQTKCVDCHDPHFQDQLYWRTDFPTDLYLVTGIIGDNSTITYQNDTTTFDYSVETWMPGWDDPTFWGNKNNTVPGRGLILNVGTTSAENTFQVISADSFTVTVQGIVEKAEANKSFGLIYGQLIKSAIKTQAGPIRDVKFFNPKDPYEGFVKTNIPAEGLCQVCHEQTVYWNADGSDTIHWSGIVCATCHISSKGFKPPSVTVGSESCGSCHAPLNSFSDIVSLHLGSCDTCHTSARPDVIAAIDSGAATCGSCHSDASVHLKPVYYYTDQVDMPLVISNDNASEIKQVDYLPFGGMLP